MYNGRNMNMALYGSLRFSPFSLICNMTTFSKKNLMALLPHARGRGCVYGQNICLHSALCSILIDLICKMTSFRKRSFDL